MLDLRIVNGKVYDGTGSPWYGADIGIRRGAIVAIGVVKEPARRTVDAAGQAVCPGFVDVHTHAESIVRRPSADNLLRQGITTVISGNCGMSPLPIRPLLEAVESARPAINFATLVGHGEIRKRAMGLAARRPTPAELSKMRRLTEQAMRDGAVGLSTGLFYVPGAYARTEEVVELSRVAAAWGGTYASHSRSAGGKILQSIAESAAIGRKARIPIEVSHLKIFHRRGRTRKDRVQVVLAEIARHRDAGVDITFDVYPYTASQTDLASVVIPSWVAADGLLATRLKDPAIRRDIRPDIAGRMAWMGGADTMTITTFPADPSVEGRTLADIARQRNQDPITAAMDLCALGPPACIFHSMREEDMTAILASEHAMIGSDACVAVSPKERVHPRYYGTFPRVLGEFVRVRGLLSLPQAIRKMTSLSARKFGLRDRGLIAVGMKADLVVFDPRTIRDRATFERPHAFPAGVNAVIVSGHLAWDGKHVSRHRAGAVIRGGS